MKIKIQTSVAAPIGETWQAFKNPGDILRWDATNHWRTTHAANDLTAGDNCYYALKVMTQACVCLSDDGG